ncbi:MAG: ABC transporter permease [Rhodoplanes sp.]
MSAPASFFGTARAHPFKLLRMGLRDLRGGLRGFTPFIACLALGVMTIAGVGSLAQSLTQGLAREGRAILGGDLSFTLVQREASPDERAFLARQGEVSATASMRALARLADGRTALVELKAVDERYPLYGAVATDPAGPLTDMLARRGDVFGAAADPLLFARFGLQPGAHVTVGSATLELRARLLSEPDKLGAGVGFGPRLLVSDEALRATGLVQPGSLVRFLYRVRLPAAGAAARTDDVAEAAEREFPNAGWEIRSNTNASPQLERNIDRFTQYLVLVGLTALLVGGVGVANSTKHYLDRKLSVIATLKSLGASATQVFVLYFFQILLLALLGAGIGLVLGALVPFAVAAAFGAIIPLPLAPSLHPAELLLGLVYGLLTAAAFALWPLGRAHDVPVSALFRDAIAPEARWPRKRYVLATAVAGLALAAVAIGASYDRKIAAVFVVAALGVFLLLRLVALAVMLIARAVPRPRSAILRLALANIHRPAALTPTIVLSLGLGVAVLVTVIEIDANLRRQFAASLPDKAPSFFFLDIPASEITRFDEVVRAQARQATIEQAPMLRGRIVDVNGESAEDLKARPDAAWVLHGDRGITFAGAVPAGSRVVEGEWWGEQYDGPPLLSMDKKIADGLGLKLSDTITVNVLGRNFTARVANLRTVDWQSLGLNFVLVFSPGAFRGAPVTHVATVSLPGGGTTQEEAALLEVVAQRFPGVTPVPVKEAISAVGAVVANLALSVQAASAVTLVSAVLVLGGALAAGHRHRVYDAVVLKAFGATRRQLIACYLLEYFLTGGAAVLFGVAAGSIAGWRVVRDLMTLPFAWQAAPALTAAAIALIVTVVCGLVGTVAALGRKPATVLRNL